MSKLYISGMPPYGYSFGRVSLTGCVGNGHCKFSDKLQEINSLSPEERKKYDEMNKKYILENLHVPYKKR